MSRPQGHSATERIMSIRNSSDTIGNRARYLPACSAVPQPVALPRTPTKACVCMYVLHGREILVCLLPSVAFILWNITFVSSSDVFLPTRCRCRSYCYTWSHSATETHSVVFYTSDQLVPETSTWHHTSMTQTGFEKAIPASERPQTGSLDSAASDISGM